MSLHLEFKPHSWYMFYAIKDNRAQGHDQSHLERPLLNSDGFRWSAYTDDGDTYRIIEMHADTLKDLKSQIKQYYIDRKPNVPAVLLRFL